MELSKGIDVSSTICPLDQSAMNLVYHTLFYLLLLIYSLFIWGKETVSFSSFANPEKFSGGNRGKILLQEEGGPRPIFAYVNDFNKF